MRQPKRAKDDTAACPPLPTPPGLYEQARSSMDPFHTPLHGGIVEIRTNSRAGTPICTIKSSASQGSEPSPQLRSGLLSAFRRDLNQSHRMHHKIRQQTTERLTHIGTMDGWVKMLVLSSITKGRASAATTGVAGARMIPVRIGARRSAEQAARITPTAVRKPESRPTQESGLIGPRGNFELAQVGRNSRKCDSEFALRTGFLSDFHRVLRWDCGLQFASAKYDLPHRTSTWKCSPAHGQCDVSATWCDPTT